MEVIMMKVTGKGRACIPEGLTKAKEVLDQLNKVCLKKNSMTGPEKPRPCSHLIYAYICFVSKTVLIASPCAVLAP